MNTLALIESALKHFTEGKPEEAEAICQQALTAEPQQPDALRLLGVIAVQRGNHDLAFDFLNQAIAAKADFAEAHYDLAFLYQIVGRADEALASFRRTVELQPNFAHGWFALGNLQIQLGQNVEAVVSYDRALEAIPAFPEALNNKGAAYKNLGQLEDARQAFAGAIAVNPAYVEAHDNLGSTLLALGRAEEAVASLEQAIALNPEHAAAHNNLGNAYTVLQRWDDAIASYRTCLGLVPDFAEGYFNLGNAYHKSMAFEDAVSCYRDAIEKDPANPSVLINLGIVLRVLGRFQESIDSLENAVLIDPDLGLARGHLGLTLLAFGRVETAVDNLRLAVSASPNDPHIHGVLIHAMQYLPDADAAELLEEARRWDEVHATNNNGIAYRNTPEPDRKLRIGYVSGDFKSHAAAYFLEPLIEGHDREAFEVFCYGQIPRPDATTERFMESADVWHNTAGMTDDQLDALIREDGIDVLIECTGHTKGNRRQALSRKPAPVQVNFVALHGETSGMACMDYALGDPDMMPPGCEDQFSEKLTLLEHGNFIFRPDDAWPDVAGPREPDAPPVFACVGAPERVSNAALELWARVLEKVPGARILFKHPAYRDRPTLAAWRERFALLAPWIEFEEVRGGWEGHMDVYGRVDVVLDTFPMTGATSCLIPLWMGVPVLTRTSPFYGHRVGVSVMRNAGMGEFVSESDEDHIANAADLITDRERLAALRGDLRGRIVNSPICDGPARIRDMEAAYRAMWQDWCAGKGHQK